MITSEHKDKDDMATNRDDWEVMSCEWEAGDCNYKVVVAKGTDVRSVRFPHKVRIGQLVRLGRV